MLTKYASCPLARFAAPCVWINLLCSKAYCNSFLSLTVLPIRTQHGEGGRHWVALRLLRVALPRTVGELLHHGKVGWRLHRWLEAALLLLLLPAMWVIGREHGGGELLHVLRRCDITAVIVTLHKLVGARRLLRV